MIRKLLGAKPEERKLSFSDIWQRGLDTSAQRSTAGEIVDYDSALTLSAVFAAIRLLSDSVSTLDLDVLFRRDGSEQKFRPLPPWIRNMNPELRNHEVLSQIITSLCLDGNAYIATLRSNNGDVVSLDVLDPTDITAKLKVDEDGLQRISFTSSKAAGEEFTSRDIPLVRG